MSIKANISTKEIGKSYSKKLGKLGGEAFWNIIANKISKRFFLEDLDNPIESEDKNNNYNYSFRNEEIKNELLKKLFPSNLSSPEENINENDSKNKQNQKGKKEGKNIGELEFGLFLKKVKGKNLIILIIIFDGKPKSFENLKKELQKEKDQNDNFFEIFRKLKNYNLYILYYPDFEDEELFNLNINIKENDERIQNLEDIIQEMREKLGLKDESKDKENKKIENEEEIEENGEKNE